MIAFFLGDLIVQLIVRLCFAGLFAVGVRHKIADLDAFRRTLWAYEILPKTWVRAAGTAIVVFEGATGLAALFAPPFVAAAAVSGLLLAYTTAISVNVARGRRDIDCGCGGPELYQRLGPALIVRNVALLVAGSSLFVTPVSRSLHWLDAVTVFACVAAAALAWQSIERLLVAQNSMHSSWASRALERQI
ncbi:MAG: hypothetical protein ACI8TX_000791 [Hyphomicrobiaceae bacterium]